MKVISKSMIAAKMFDKYFDEQREAHLANSIKSMKDIFRETEMLFRELGIPPNILNSLFKTESLFVEDLLTIAIGYVILSKEIPSEVQEVLKRTMPGNTLELLRLLQINIHNQSK